MNFLTREELIKQVKELGMWEETMNKERALELLSAYEEIIDKYEYEEDSNWVVFGRRDGLIETVDMCVNSEKLPTTIESVNRGCHDLIWTFWEFISDSYPGLRDINHLSEEELEGKDLSKMYMDYREKGIISLQEKNIILELINKIRNYINKL